MLLLLPCSYLFVNPLVDATIPDARMLQTPTQSGRNASTGSLVLEPVDLRVTSRGFLAQGSVELSSNGRILLPGPCRSKNCSDLHCDLA